MDPVLLVQGCPSSSLTPLFLVHAVSGVTLPYFALGQLDGSERGRPVYGITSPLYTQDNYRLPSTLHELAKEYVELIRREVQPHGPYLLGGWSMGGMIAVKMAQLLEDMGETVLRIIMIDSLNPTAFKGLKNAEELEAQTTRLLSAIASRVGVTDAPRSDDSESAQETDEEGEIFEKDDVFQRMKWYIRNGLMMIAAERSSPPARTKCLASAVLIRCTTFGPHERRLNNKPLPKTMGWNRDDFGDFRVINFSGHHDAAFDHRYVDELTYIMREIVSGIS